VEFEATLQADERGHVRLPMPFDPNAEWGKRARHYVRGTLNDVAFEGTLGSRGGGYFFPVNKNLRDRLQVTTDVPVRVVIKHSEPPETELPQDLSLALAGEPAAAGFFAGLSGFYQRQYVHWIESAKQPATRKARIAEVVDLLRAGQRQRTGR